MKCLGRGSYLQSWRRFATMAKKGEQSLPPLNINNFEYYQDDYTNVTPKILSHIGQNLHNQKYHPLGLIKQRIVNHFYSAFVGHRGIPVFAVFDNLHPVVSVEKNFDSLLIPLTHVSRNKSDCYYVNKQNLLRAHTTAHQLELLRMGLDNCLMIGDVYRRDEIDPTHYPVFHQVDAVRLCTENKVCVEM